MVFGRSLLIKIRNDFLKQKEFHWDEILVVVIRKGKEVRESIGDFWARDRSYLQLETQATGQHKPFKRSRILYLLKKHTFLKLASCPYPILLASPLHDNVTFSYSTDWYERVTLISPRADFPLWYWNTTEVADLGLLFQRNRTSERQDIYSTTQQPWRQEQKV